MTDRAVRLEVRCRGAVQGVGFRPTVHRIATELGLTGEVRNDPDGATAEVEGPRSATARFVERLTAELPPLARLDDLSVTEIACCGDREFRVTSTRQGQRAGALVPPDAALCSDCRREMADPSDRRHHYPFTTCTNCGPRFSLTRSLPYDRDTTSMACFPLCPDCDREYRDTADRRFHAEPVCCPECGPRLWIQDADGGDFAEGAEAVSRARRDLCAGKIVAVKGLGGFQLACRADDPEVVERLRSRKRRPGKPFAVMVRNLAAAHREARLSEADAALLGSPRAPVLLAPRHDGGTLCAGIAPGLGDVGVMLPTTPLHVELFRDPQVPALVMTSANLSDEPICRGNREALERLVAIADRFLLHDRDIVRRVDDSVVRSTTQGPTLVRRARGWVPEPLPLPVAAPEPILAVGGHLMVTACVAVGRQAFCSQHIGDLDSESARLFHREVIDGLEDFLEVRPTQLIADHHPDYPSTWLAGEIAERRRGTVRQVQHHIAHIGAVLAEHRRFPELDDTVLGVGLDGTGWGLDGTAWGGEWLSLDGRLRWRRLGHLQPLPLVGGERAVRGPWRVAVAALALADRLELLPELPVTEAVERQRIETVAELAGSPSWPRASGAGRLFEAAGALLGLVVRNDWEGEAAARLEALAASCNGAVPPWPEVVLDETGRSPVLPSAALLAAAAQRLVDGEPPARVAAGLHRTFVALAADLTESAAAGHTPPVALGGGCLVNRLLLGGLSTDLTARGFEVLVPRMVPPGDGGLSYGQAVIGSVALARGVRPELVHE
ncbi:MAG: carbamoyltransferase HypF [Holophagae bacterium]